MKILEMEREWRENPYNPAKPELENILNYIYRKSHERDNYFIKPNIVLIPYAAREELEDELIKKSGPIQGSRIDEVLGMKIEYLDHIEDIGFAKVKLKKKGE